MGISEHAELFAGLPVRDYDPAESIVDPAGAAQRVGVGHERFRARQPFLGRLGRFLDDPVAGQVVALVIGAWDGLYEGQREGETEQIIAALAGARERLPGLRALFFGDVTQDECEISWINQADITPLLEAYPALERLRVRGSNSLSIRPIRHEALRELTIESGGLPPGVVRQMIFANLPNLEHLELWLGAEEYGGDTSPDDLEPLLSGALFPRLKYLGLRNCEYADALAAALARCPILKRIEVLDLSLGNLGDEGALALLAGGQLAGLKKLDIHHHYVSDEVLDGLKDLGIELDATDTQEPDYWDDEDEEGEGHRYCAVSE
jgi:hypothetical protein